jgi:hypothetical protein
MSTDKFEIETDPAGADEHIAAIIAAYTAGDDVAVAELIALQLIGFADPEGFAKVIKYYPSFE